MSALMTSCAPADDGLTTISISHRYVDSGSMYATRAEIAPHISEALEAIMPQSVPLTIGNERSVHTCMSGRKVTLPYGHYSVSGESRQTRTYISESAWASAEPLITVDDDIDVVSGMDEYTVNATIGSFVIAWNNTVVESISVSGSAEALPCVKYEDTSVCCITGDLEELSITLHPWISQSWEARSFTLTTLEGGCGIRCEKGHWYALSPIAVPTEIGSINIHFEEWVEGGNYY